MLMIEVKSNIEVRSNEGTVMIKINVTGLLNHSIVTYREDV